MLIAIAAGPAAAIDAGDNFCGCCCDDSCGCGCSERAGSYASTGGDGREDDRYNGAISSTPACAFTSALPLLLLLLPLRAADRDTQSAVYLVLFVGRTKGGFEGVLFATAAAAALAPPAIAVEDASSRARSSCAICSSSACCDTNRLFSSFVNAVDVERA